MALTLEEVKQYIPELKDKSVNEIISLFKEKNLDTSALMQDEETGLLRNYVGIPLLKGAGGVGSSVGYALEATGIAPETGRAIQESGEELTQTLTRRQSQQAQEDAQKRLIDKNGNYGGYNTGTFTQQLSESLPAMATMAVPGTVAARTIEGGLKLAGAGKATAGLLANAVGYGASEGVVSGAQNAAQIQQEIRNTDITVLSQHPAFNKVREEDTDPSLTDEERNIAARELLARKAGDQVFVDTTIKTGGIGMLTGGGMPGMLRSGAAGNLGQRVATGIVKEGVLQEAPQSALEQRTINQAKKDYLNPNQDVNEDVLTSGLEGGLVGTAMGGFGGLAKSKSVDEAILESDLALQNDAPLPPSTELNVEPINENLSKIKSTRAQQLVDQLKAHREQLIIDEQQLTTGKTDEEQITDEITNEETRQGQEGLLTPNEAINEQKESTKQEAEISLREKQVQDKEEDNVYDPSFETNSRFNQIANDQETTQTQDQVTQAGTELPVVSDTGRPSGPDDTGTSALSGGLPEQDESAKGQDVSSAGSGVGALTPEVKQPWQQTKEEFLSNPEIRRQEAINAGIKGEKSQKFIKGGKALKDVFAKPDNLQVYEFSINKHKEDIQKAIQRGETVPPEVLADYPDLQNATQTPTPATPATETAYTEDDLIGTKSQPANRPDGSSMNLKVSDSSTKLLAGEGPSKAVMERLYPGWNKKGTPKTGATSAPKNTDTIVKGEVGGKISKGEVQKTVSGRLTTPHPGTFRNNKGGKWLLENAALEAESRGDDFNARTFRDDLKSKVIPQASKDSAEEYLFGYQPEVEKPITKPLIQEKPIEQANQQPEKAPQGKETAAEGGIDFDEWTNIVADVKEKEKQDSSNKVAIIKSLRDHAQKEIDQAEIWKAKNYKDNKKQVELRGDGPSRNETMSIGAINEGRKNKNIKYHSDNAKTLFDMADDIESGKVSIEFLKSELTRIKSIVNNEDFRGTKHTTPVEDVERLFADIVLKDTYQSSGINSPAHKIIALLEKETVTEAPKEYHPAIKSYADELVVGGGVSYTYDEAGKINGRTPSVNPEWFKDGAFVVLNSKGNTGKVSVKEIKDAVDAYEGGGKVTAKQERILQALSDVAQAEEDHENSGYPDEFNYETKLITQDLENKLNQGEISLDDINTVLDDYDDSIPFGTKGSELSYEEFEQLLGVTPNEQAESKDSTDVLEEEILAGYSEQDLADREKTGKDRLKKESDAELKAKQKRQAEQEIDTLADEMLGNLDSTVPGATKFSKNKPTTGSTRAELVNLLSADDKKLLEAGTINIIQRITDIPKDVLNNGDVLTRKNSVVAWHGGPHDHNKFDSSKIGTGEGAQAFGYGHYFTDAREIADWYRKKLSKSYTGIGDIAEDWLNQANGDVVKAVQMLKDFVGYDETGPFALSEKRRYETDELIKEITRSKGKLYQVELAPEPDELLDWDKPLSDQSEKVRNAIKTVHEYFLQSNRNILIKQNTNDEIKSGGELYKSISHNTNPRDLRRNGIEEELSHTAWKDKRASLLLNKLGIRGIRYKAEAGKSDAYNYVIFSDDDISIKEKYSKDEQIEGFYKDGKIYLIADNIAPDNLQSVLNHEKLHAALDQNPKLKERLLGAQSELNDIFDQVESGKYTGRYKEIYDAAMKRVDRAKTAPDARREEFLAYAVSVWEKSPQSLPARLAKAIANMVAAIKAAIYRYSGYIGKISPADLSALAVSSMKSSALPTSSNAVVMASKQGYKGNDTGEAMEWLRAKAKGLDMSQEARVERAKAMGFDVDNKYYVSSLEDVKEFKPSGKFAGYSGVSGISVSDNPNLANRYLDRYLNYGWVDGKPNQPFNKNVIPVFIKPGNMLDVKNSPYKSPVGIGLPLPNNYINPLIKDGYDSMRIPDRLNRKGATVKHTDAKNSIIGYEIVLTNPNQIRSINAAFDPDYADSPNLLASTKAERLYSAMRDKILNEGMPLFSAKQSKEQQEYDDTRAKYFGTKDWMKAPNQIKSALGNTGKFSPESNDIRFSIADDIKALTDRDKPIKTLSDLDTAMQSGVMPKTSLNWRFVSDAIATYMVDSTRPFTVWLRKLPNTLTAGRVVLSLELVKTRASAMEKTAQEDYLQPLSEEIAGIAKKKGWEFAVAKDVMGHWMTARYAIEKNQDYIRQDQEAVVEATTNLSADPTNSSLKGALTKAINKQRKRLDAINEQRHIDPTEESLIAGLAGGYNNFTAHEQMKKYEAAIPKAQMEKAAKHVYKMLAWKKQKDIDNGKVTQAMVDTWQNSPHYVPLTGDPTVDESENELFQVGNINQPKDKKAIGRAGSLAQNGIDAAVEQVQKSARYHGWVDFKDNFAAMVDDLILDEMSNGLTAIEAEKEVYDQYKINVKAENPRTQLTDTQFIIRKNGQGFVYDVHNSDAINALKSTNKEDTPSLLAPVTWFTRTYAYVVTQLMPGFAQINATRDIWERSENIRTKILPGYETINMDSVGRGALGIFADVRTPKKIASVLTKNKIKWDQSDPDIALIKEMIAEGVASTLGYYLAGNNLDIAKQMEGSVKISKEAAELISIYNNSFELLSTFSIYKSLKEHGVDKKTAASGTLGLMNYTKSGTAIGPMRALYAFVNPTMQGGHQMILSFSTPKGRARACAYVLSSILLYTMLRAIDGDDDELGVNKMDNQSSYILERNIPVPIGDGAYLKIPIGFGKVQAMWSMGVNIVKWAAGSQSAEDATAEIMKSFSRTLAPVQPSETKITRHPIYWMMQTITPQIAKPIVNIGIDRTMFGQPLTNARFVKQDVALALQGRKSTSQFYKDMAKSLSEMGIDMYPEQVKEVWRGYMVGPINELITKPLIENPNKESMGRKTVSPFIDRYVSVHDSDSVKERMYYNILDELQGISSRSSLNKELNPKEKRLLLLYKNVTKLENQARGKLAAATKTEKKGGKSPFRKQGEKLKENAMSMTMSQYKKINE